MYSIIYSIKVIIQIRKLSFVFMKLISSQILNEIKHFIYLRIARIIRLQKVVILIVG
jgi:hypothetical protein